MRIFKTTIIIVIILITLGLVTFSQAAISKQINYQGRLADSAGTAVVNGNYDIKFVIYNAASGGQCLWTARGTCAAVTARSTGIVQGLFSVMLGDEAAGDNALNLDFATTTASYYIGVTVGTDAEMTPRKSIGSVPMAYNANNLIGDGGINLTSTSTSPVVKITASSTDPLVNFIQNGAGPSLLFGESNNGNALAPASSTISLLQFSSNPLSSGSSNGTLIGANPTSFSGNFLDFQVGGAQKFVVSALGNATTTGSLSAPEFCFGNDCRTSWPAASGVAAWEQKWTGVITPTSTNAGIFVSSASSTIFTLRVPDGLNATTTNIGALTIYDSIMANVATSTITNLTTNNATTTNNLIVGATSWAAPTSTLTVNGSGYFTGNFVTSGNATTSGRLVIGTTQPTNDYGKIWIGGDVYNSGNATTTGTLQVVTALATGTAQPNSTTTANFGGNVYVQGIATTTGNFAVSSTTQADHPAMFVDSQTGRVGIGTTTPSALLQIGFGNPSTAVYGIQFGNDVNLYRLNGGNLKSDDSINAASFVINGGGSITRNGTTGDVTLVQSTGNGNLILGINNDVTILRTGLVGIGLTNPTSTLSVNGSADIRGNATTTGNLIVGASSWAAPTNTLTVNGSLYATGNATTSGSLAAGGTLYVQQDTGKVGIGTTAPDRRLTIVGSDSTFPGISIYGGGSVGSSNLVATLYDGAASTKQGVLTLYEAGTAKVLFSGGTNDSSYILSGNVGIGTADPKGIGHIYRGASGISTFDTDGDEFIIESNARAGMTLAAPDNQLSYLLFANPSDTYAAVINWDYTNRLMQVGPSTDGGELLLSYGSSASNVGLKINSTGKVGLGLTNPTSTLSVAGSADIRGAATTTGNLIVGANTWVAPTNTLTVNGSLYATGNATTSGAFSAGELLYVKKDTGNVGIGTTAPLGKLHTVVSGDANTLFMDTYRDSAGQNQMAMRFARGSATAPTIVQNNDQPFLFLGQGYDGSVFRSSAALRFEIDGTPGASDMPGRIIFSTTPDGASTYQDRMTIKNNGDVGIGITEPGTRLHVSGGGLLLDRYNGDVDPTNIQGSIWVKEGAISGYEAMIFRSTGYQLQSDTGTAYATILSNGNLGLGLTNPTSTLSVAGSVDIRGNATTTGNLILGANTWDAPTNTLTVAGSAYIIGNATTSGTFHSPEICIGNDCQTTWPNAGSGAWETFASGVLRPTSTAAAILINSSTSTITNLTTNNATTTNNLIVGASSWAAPTSTLTVNGSGYFTGNFVTSGNATTSGRLVIGTTQPTNDYGKIWIGGDVYNSGNATTTGTLQVVTSLSTGTAQPNSTTTANFGGNVYIQGSATTTGNFAVSSTTQADRPTLFVNSQTGRVGIGTANPSSTLQVMNGGITAGTGYSYYEGYDGDNNAAALLEGDVKARAIRDALGWIQNQGGIEKLKLGYNNGGFGGGATPGNIIMGATTTSVYDTTAVNSNSKGFQGAVFDGRYIYFVPYYNGTGYSGQVTRYDTTGSFTTSGSWSVYDTTAVNANSKGFMGAVFDGRYIYFVPYYNGTYFGQVTRYDTTASFTTSGSWSVYDTTAVNANSKGFTGGVFDGRYIYFVPYSTDITQSGQVTRYDTTASFTTSGSWSVYDTTAVNANSKGFHGAVFDGRYIYFVPYHNGAAFGQVTRYDTTASFTTSGSWSVYDTTNVNANSKGFVSGVFDGRYIYFTPYDNGSAFGQVTRYDTTGSFTTSGSWSVYDTTNVNANSKGFMSGIFDGRYIYLTPYDNGFHFGQVTRLKGWTGGVDSAVSLAKIARGSDLYINSAGNVGLGLTNPTSTLSVAGSADIRGNATTTGNLIVGASTWDAPTNTATINGSLYATGNATTSGTFHSPEICIGNDCQTSWPNAGSGAWETFASGVLRPTSTTAAILINSSTSTITNLTTNNATTTGNLIVGTTSWAAPTNTLTVNGSGLFTGNATTSGAFSAGGLLYVKQDTGYVGIGTTNPYSKLDISASGGGSDYANTSMLSLYNNSGYTNLRRFTLGNSFNTSVGMNSLLFNLENDTGTLVRRLMILQSNGNVGVGLTNPTSTLSVAGSADIRGNATTTGNLIVGANTWDAPTNTLTVNGSLYATGNATTSGAFSAGSTLYVKEDTGNIGVGAVAPSAKLDVSASSTNSIFQINASSTSPIVKVIQNGAGSSFLFATSTNPNIPLAPASSTIALMQFGPDTLTSGSANGTLIGANPFAFNGNFIDFQVAGVSKFTLSGTQATFGVPVAMNAAGDTEISYNLLFSNPVRSDIKSSGPLYITAGDAGASSNLFLAANNAGVVYVNDELQVYGSTTLATTTGIISWQPLAADQKLLFRTATNTLASLDYSGNLMIGANTWAAATNTLTIVGSGYFTNNLITSGNATTSGNVVIGASSWAAPTSTLTVNGSGYFTGNFVTSGNATTSGRLVIGTTQPTNDYGKIWIGGDVYNSGNSTTTGTLQVVTSLATGTAQPNSTTTANFGGNVYIQGIATTTGNFAVSSTTAAERPTLFVNSQTGNVGIGTAAPSSKFAVHTDNIQETIAMQLYDAYNRSSGVRFNLQTAASGSTSNDGFSYIFVNPDAYLWNYESGEIRFGTNNIQRMMIKSTGNVGIGLTNPTSTLSVAGSTDIRGNATTTGNLIVGTNTWDAPTNTLTVAGSAYITGNATTSGTFHSPEICIGNSCQTSWPTGGYVGQPGAWETFATGVLRPTSTTAAILINSSTSTITNLTTNNATTTNNLIVGATSWAAPTSTLTVNGSGYFTGNFVTSGNATTSGNFAIASTTVADRPTMFVNSQTGNIGIGVANPENKLQVEGSVDLNKINDILTRINIANNRVMFGYNGYDAIIQGDSARGVKILSGNGNFGSGSGIYVNTSGNVGVGTTTPLAKLSVHANNDDPYTEYLFDIASSTSAATTTLFVVNNDGQVGIGTNVFDTTDSGYKLKVAGSIKMTAGGDFYNQGQDLSFYNDSTRNFYFKNTNEKAYLTIKNTTGNVGIGITNPTSTLSVAGSADIRGSATTTGNLIVGANTWDAPTNTLTVAGSAYITGNATTSGTLQVVTSLATGTAQPNSTTTANFGGNVYIQGIATTTGNFAVSSTTQADKPTMFVNSQNGRVGIGTLAPSTKFQVSVTGSTDAMRLASDQNSVGLVFNSAAGASARIQGTTSLSNGELQFVTNDIERVRINASGNVGIGLHSPTSTLSVNGSADIWGSATTTGNFIVGTSSWIAPTNTATINGSLYATGNATTSGAFSAGSVLYVKQDTGNIGVGIVNPSAKLDVSASSTNSIFQINASSTSALVRLVQNGASGSLLFATSTNPNTPLAPASSTIALMQFGPDALTSGSANGTLIGANPYAFTGNLIDLQVAGVSKFKLSGTQATFGVPVAMNAAGDTEISYNLLFSNPISSDIKSSGPLYITAGDAGTNSNLTLKGNNTGVVFVDDELQVYGSTTLATTTGIISWQPLAVDQKLLFRSGTTTLASLSIGGGWTTKGPQTQNGAPDYAEFILSTDKLEDGDLIATREKTEEEKIKFPVSEPLVEKAQKGGNEVLTGVIASGSSSQAAGYLQEDYPNNAYLMTLSGRVGVKVSNENGPVRRGDYLTISSIAGVAMKATMPGPIIGTALEDFDENKAITENSTTTDLILNNNLDSSATSTATSTDNLAATSTDTTIATSTVAAPNEIKIGKVLTLIHVDHYNPASGIALQGSDPTANYALSVNGGSEWFSIDSFGERVVVTKKLVVMQDVEFKGNVVVEGTTTLKGDLELGGAITQEFYFNGEAGGDTIDPLDLTLLQSSTSTQNGATTDALLPVDSQTATTSDVASEPIVENVNATSSATSTEPVVADVPQSGAADSGAAASSAEITQSIEQKLVGKAVYICDENTVCLARADTIVGEDFKPAIGIIVKVIDSSTAPTGNESLAFDGRMRVKVAIAGVIKGFGGLESGKRYYLPEQSTLDSMSELANQLNDQLNFKLGLVPFKPLGVESANQVIGIAKSKEEFLVMPDLGDK